MLLAVTVWVGCSTTTPRVVEVSVKRYGNGTSRPGEDYFVSWKPSTVNTVKFEYRQVRVPNKILEQTCTSATSPCATFPVRGKAFESGGPVSAWRVSLWTDSKTCVAEKKSALW
jgi:hypothetical protein